MMNNSQKNIREQLVNKAIKFKNRIIEDGIANPDKIKGCSEAEILVLEKASGLTLPFSYKVFLRHFGHGLGGRIMNDVEYQYDSVFSFIEDLKEFRLDGEEPEFPPNTFFWSARYKEQYLFFIVDENIDDPPIYHWMVDNDYFSKTSDSIFETLEKETKLTEFAVSRMKNKK